MIADDIVERMRYWNPVTFPLASLAADEIERLAARLAEVDKTLRPLVDDDNRPVEALARAAVDLVADAQEELRKCQQDAIQLQAQLAAAERERDALRESTKDWYKHPSAQNEIALKARLRLELSHIEAIVRGDGDLDIDDDYWSTLCDDVLKLRRDAARYRLLRKKAALTWTRPPSRAITVSWINNATPEELDAAVDAELGREP